MNTKVFESKIRETVRVKDAYSQQEPIIELDVSWSAVKDYKAYIKKEKI